MMGKTWIGVWMVSVVLALAVGCSSSSGVRVEDPDVPVLEKVEVLSEATPPEWVLAPNKYRDAKKDYEYFRGIGFPRQTLVFATESAAENAYSNIARYIGQVVAVKWQSAGEAKNLHGQQSIETVVEEFVKKTIAIARVKNARLVESHIERVSAFHNNTQVLMNRVYQLYEVPTSALVETARNTAAAAAEEIQSERDAVRKQQLQKLEEMLKNLSTNDFAL
jgi:uncharacterized protein YcfL